MTVYLTDVDDRPRINPVRQEVFGDARPASTLVEVTRARDPECADRGRGGRGRPRELDPYNAVITDVEPAQALPGPLNGKRLLVKDLIDTAGIRTTYGSKIYADHVPDADGAGGHRLVDAGAVVVGKANLPEFAWGVTGQNPFYGTVHNPAAPGKTTGGSSSGNAAALAAGMCDIALGTDTGCSIRLPSACCEIRRAEAAVGLDLDGRRLPALPDARHGRPDGADGRGRRARLVGAQGRAGARAAARGLTVGLLDSRPRSATGARPSRATSPSAGSAELERLGARVVEARVPGAVRRTPGRASATRRCSRTGRRSRRAPPSTRDVCRTKLETAQQTTPDEVAAAYRRSRSGGRRARGRPLRRAVLTQDLPPEDADELEVRLRFSQFLRWVNLIGWAGLAIGNLQLIAPHDETVLATGLAYVRG